jgi:hypothetical protein
MKDEISVTELLGLRLHNQRLTFHKEKTTAALVSHFGAIQAQDLNMALWALGARLPGLNQHRIEHDLDSGKIIRTHVLRPTWHFVSPRHLRWMLELSAPRIRASMNARNKQLGLTAKVFAKSNRLIEELLQGRSLDRAEIIAALAKEKINTSDYRSGHLLLEAELEGLICSGNTKQSYALVKDRIPAYEEISRDKALQTLATLYFRSHGPASVADFTWWSGLSPSDARSAVVSLPSSFRQVTCGDQTLYYQPVRTSPAQIPLLLLPAFDEYTIAYKDREAVTESKHRSKVISVNGIFYPLLVINAKVAGLWKRKAEGDTLHVTVNSFARISPSQKDEIIGAAGKLAWFLSKEKTVCTFDK